MCLFHSPFNHSSMTPPPNSHPHPPHHHHPDPISSSATPCSHKTYQNPNFSLDNTQTIRYFWIMEASQNPSSANLPTLADLTPRARLILDSFLAAPASLPELAARVGCTVLEAAEALLDPRAQAALAEIESLSRQLARLAALFAGPTAVATLAQVSTPDAAPDPVERRRAAVTLLRAANRPATSPTRPRSGRQTPASGLASPSPSALRPPTSVFSPSPRARDRPAAA